MERERLSYTIHYTDHEKQKKKKERKKKQATKWSEKSTLKLLRDFIPPQTEQSRSRKVVTAIAVQDVENGSGPHSLLVRL